jgi:hypothetical protein
MNAIIPIHLQRRFEQRWAAKLASLVASAAPKSIGLRATLKNLPRATRAKGKPAGLSRRVRSLPLAV